MWLCAQYIHPGALFTVRIFAGKCIKEDKLDTILIPKTGTIVPEYKREFYLPDESIHSSVITISEFTRKHLIDSYHIPDHQVKLIYQGTDVKRFTPSKKGKENPSIDTPYPKMLRLSWEV